MLDFARLDAANIADEPFAYAIVPGFVLAGISRCDRYRLSSDRASGSFPLAALSYGPAFAAMIDNLTGSRRCARSLRGNSKSISNQRPVMVTVRGQCTARDGHIHTDSTKARHHAALHQPQLGMRERATAAAAFADDLKDFAAEVPPKKARS